MYKTHNFARVVHWRFIIEEFGPRLVYIPGKKNIVADALSCLLMCDTLETLNTVRNVYACAVLFALDKEEIPLRASLNLQNNNGTPAR